MTLFRIKCLQIKAKTHIKSKFATNSKSITYKAVQEKVLNWTSKGRLLEANWASFQSQKTMYWF